MWTLNICQNKRKLSNMKPILILILCSFCLLSCGQRVGDTNQKVDRIDDKIYDTMVSEVCKCATGEIKKINYTYH